MAGRSNKDWDIYGSTYHLGFKPLTSCRAVMQDIRHHGWQIWMIFKSNFALSFRETSAGLVWGLLLPLVPIIAFLFLSLLRVFPADRLIHPVSYLMLGMLIWLLLQGLVIVPINAITRYKAVVKSTEFPLICIFLASYGQLAFDTLVRLLLVLPVVMYFSDFDTAGLLLLPLLLLPAIAFGIALGVTLGLANIVLGDIKNLTDVAFRYLIFISLAIFPLPLTNKFVWWLVTLNPFAIYIDNIRSMLLLGKFSTPLHFGILSGLSILALVLVLHVYYVLERRVAGVL